MRDLNATSVLENITTPALAQQQMAATITPKFAAGLSTLGSLVTCFLILRPKTNRGAGTNRAATTHRRWKTPARIPRHLDDRGYPVSVLKLVSYTMGTPVAITLR